MSRRRPTHDSPKQQRHRPQQSTEQQQPNLGMSPEARYAHNLKVLRRRDPSIIKIFDQFSHVCVYHHNGITWEKNGYEGSMFLYESDSYPPYGFYILNRMGMDDYIQRLYPEDVSGPHGTYLMLRSYPAFATRRVSAVLASHDEPPPKFADAWACPDLDNPDLDKGEGHTVGLWMFPTDAREPMIDVMVRLHSYVKQNVPYPDQFQYGPNRPPPPNPHLRTTSPSPPPHESHVNPTSNAPNAPTADGAGERDSAFPTGSATELDQLFARMRTTSSSAVTPTTPALRATTVPPASAGARPTATARPSSTMTVASLFAALGGGEGGTGTHANEAVPKSPTSPTRSGSGIALLDSIFASASAASTPASTPASAPRTTPRTTNIHSPTPSTSTSISSRAPPQVLNHDVITSLLGLPRAGSAASAGSGYSNSSASGRHTTSSREGDNEYEEEEGDGETPEDHESEGSTVLDEEEEEEGLNGAAGRGGGSGRPLLGLGGPTPRAGTRSLPVVNGTGAQVNGSGNNSKNGNGKASGDVTPRAPVPGNGVAHSQRRAASVPVPPPMSQSSSTGTVTTRAHAAAPKPHPQSHPQSPAAAAAAAGRTSFAASAELWPTADDDDDADGDGEIVELDFSDTRALSDPEALREVMQRRRGKQASVPVTRHEESAAATLNGASANGAASRGEGEKVGERRGKGKKKGKRERAAERAAEAEVQRGLEAARLGGMLLDSAAGRGRAGLGDGDGDGEASPSSSRDASASPDPERAHRGVFGEVQVQPVQQVQAKPAIVNGHGHGPSSAPAVRAPPPAATALDATQARAAMLSALTRPRPGAGEVRARLPMEKNAFMREVLTLIHTDKAFVDALWQDYVARVD